MDYAYLVYFVFYILYFIFYISIFCQFSKFIQKAQLVQLQSYSYRKLCSEASHENVKLYFDGQNLGNHEKCHFWDWNLIWNRSYRCLEWLIQNQPLEVLYKTNCSLKNRNIYWILFLIKLCTRRYLRAVASVNFPFRLRQG